jgi:DNA-binding MarR family transcriptional regulator
LKLIQTETTNVEAAALLDALAAVRRALGSEAPLENGESIAIGQFLALRALSVRDRTATELARAISVRLPALTQIVDGLVRRGWVERYDDPSDRRRVCLRLTDSGRDVYLQARHGAEGRMARLIEHLNERERRALFRGLDVLRSALSELGRSASARRSARAPVSK